MSKPATKISLRRFNDRCPKCTAVAGTRMHCGGCKDQEKPEHLHAVCGRCMFCWLERCADAKGARGDKGPKAEKPG